MTLGSFTRRLLWSLCGIMLLWFFIFFVVLCCCLHIWRSSHFIQSLQSAFRREIPTAKSCKGFWGLLRPRDTPAPHFSFSWQNVWNCMPSLDPEVCQGGYWKPRFCFPKDGVKPQVCGPSLAHRFRLTFCVSSLSVCQSSFLLQPGSSHKLKRCMDEAAECSG